MTDITTPAGTASLIFSLLVWLFICALAVWASVEVTHHSQIGGIWRWFGKQLQKIPAVAILGDGALCPFCTAAWFGLLYTAVGVFLLLPFWVAIPITFIGGLAAARLANLGNDYFHYVCRTPDLNEDSRSARMTNSWNADQYDQSESSENEL